MAHGPITFDPDVYGTYARASAAADYVELLLLNGGPPVQLAQIGDWIEDSSWERLFEPHFGNVGSTRQQFDSDMSAQFVFEVLRQRADLLADRYPIDIQQDTALPVPLQNASGEYRFLLGICVAHAYGIDLGVAPTTTFELSIERALVARAGLATSFRQHLGGSFHDALVAATSAVGLRAAPEGAAIPVSFAANDEGLDVLAHMHWGDDRIGRWTFIGQATVAKSDRWGTKVSDPRTAQWKDLIEERVPPCGFLAVPHHIQDDHWSHLVLRERVLLDRLRLTQWLTPLAGDEPLFSALVTDLEIDPIVET